ncbi:hypothetical protein BCR44DRAFT_1439793 [Catenaria anguillulae PL171]|uniref:Uncharacterized protein n=1 Tax=Catenaria anguillulae PL171 TaxID=765915 RepID=A0A1Y2HI21_9FUNG|nr:hypothetical protein BCR44DRAFT_1439793 [Catenaria anguillulae PL171]
MYGANLRGEWLCLSQNGQVVLDPPCVARIALVCIGHFIAVVPVSFALDKPVSPYPLALPPLFSCFLPLPPHVMNWK